ncbi:MAG: hypothetical protein V4478_03685 [Patescibacteria group bacterium]
MIINHIENKTFLDILCGYAAMIKTSEEKSRLFASVEEVIIAKYVSVPENRGLLAACIHLLEKEGSVLAEKIRSRFLTLRIYGFQIGERLEEAAGTDYCTTKKAVLSILQEIRKKEETVLPNPYDTAYLSS